MRDHLGIQNLDLDIMYMPMNANHFHNDNFHEAILILFPIIIALFSGIGMNFANQAQENKESELKTMLDRIGTRPLPQWTVDTIIDLKISLLIAPGVAAIGSYLVIHSI